MEQREMEDKSFRGIRLKESEDVYREVLDIVRWDKEVFVAFYLDSKNRVISREVIAIGTLNSVLVHPREVFRTAVIRAANAIIVVHNHPSGDSAPSEEDIQITEKLKRGGETLGIRLLDHVIVGIDGHYSFSQEKAL